MAEMTNEKQAQQAAETLRMVLPLMAKHHVPVDPKNYAVWFEYVVGENEELNQVIDDVIQAGHDFGEELNDDLFRRFVQTKGEKAIEGVRNSARQLLQDVVETIGESTETASQYSQKLVTSAQKLQSAEAVNDLRDYINEIVSETETMISSNQNVHEQLTIQSSQIDNLQSDLDEKITIPKMDILTGLVSRESFDDEIHLLAKEAVDAQAPLSLVIAEIDHFERFVDTFGSLLGDKLLRFVAKCMKSTTKGKDIIARYGYARYALILPHTPIEGSLVLSENLRTFIGKQKLRLSLSKQKIGSITMSFGCAEYRLNESVQAWVERAESALELAQTRGADRVVSEEDLV